MCEGKIAGKRHSLMSTTNIRARIFKLTDRMKVADERETLRYKAESKGVNGL